MTTKTLPKSITVIGRRWFQRTYGNTYFSAQIYVDGEPVHQIPFAYGYGEQYLWEAFTWLIQKGIIPRSHEERDTIQQVPTIYCRERGIKLVYSVSDVERKKDL